MNLSEAKKKLIKLFGDKAFYRLNPKAPDAAERESLRARCEPLKKDRDELEAERDARRAEILAADERYQELKKAAHAKRTTLDDLRGRLASHRVEFGRAESIFNVVEGSGDTWADAFADYDRKQTRR